MYLENVTTTCPKCGFTIPIYPNQKFVTCKNCEKKIKISEFEGENEIMNNKKTYVSYGTVGDLITGSMPNKSKIGGIFVSPITIEQEKYIKELIQSELNKPLDVKIKYHDPNMPKLEKITKGNWIDCRVIEGGAITRFNENGIGIKSKIVFEDIRTIKEDATGYEVIKTLKYKKGDFMMLCLGISLNQGEGYEVQTNHFGVGDDTFVGNGDIYHFPCYALADGEIRLYERVCQMRINKSMGQINFNEVDDMEAEDRKGFGSTGTR
jgi:dUTP pyrophosphatase